MHFIAKKMHMTYNYNMQTSERGMIRPKGLYGIYLVSCLLLRWMEMTVHKHWICLYPIMRMQ